KHFAAAVTVIHRRAEHFAQRPAMLGRLALRRRADGSNAGPLMHPEFARHFCDGRTARGITMHMNRTQPPGLGELRAHLRRVEMERVEDEAVLQPGARAAEK